MAAVAIVKAPRFFSSAFGVIRRTSNLHYSSASTEDGNKMEAVQNNPFYAKYADKMAALQKTAPEEFVARLEQVAKSVGHHTEVTDQLSASAQQSPLTAITANKCCLPKSRTTATSRPASQVRSRLLYDIMKVDLIRHKSPEEVSKIWLEYHQKQKNMIAAIIPAETYSTIFERSQRFPTFLYPVPRQQGFEFFMAQFSHHECHFTRLINYQMLKENASECLTIMHYSELEAEKGVVLMRGEYDVDVVTGIEARCLVNQVQLYYNSKPDSERYRLLEAFTVSPNEFKHDDLINQLANLQP